LLFRDSINGRGGPLSYDAAHHRWQTYCAQGWATRSPTPKHPSPGDAGTA
jgi:hypothetical protein